MEQIINNLYADLTKILCQYYANIHYDYFKNIHYSKDIIRPLLFYPVAIDTFDNVVNTMEQINNSPSQIIQLLKELLNNTKPQFIKTKFQNQIEYYMNEIIKTITEQMLQQLDNIIDQQIMLDKEDEEYKKQEEIKMKYLIEIGSILHDIRLYFQVNDQTIQHLLLYIDSILINRCTHQLIKTLQPIIENSQQVQQKLPVQGCQLCYGDDYPVYFICTNSLDNFNQQGQQGELHSVCSLCLCKQLILSHMDQCTICKMDKGYYMYKI